MKPVVTTAQLEAILKAHGATTPGRWYVTQRRGHYFIALCQNQSGLTLDDTTILRAPAPDRIQNQDQVFNDLTFVCEAHAILPAFAREIHRVKSKAALYEKAILKLIEDAPEEIKTYLQDVKKKADSFGVIYEPIVIEDDMLPRFATLEL